VGTRVEAKFEGDSLMMGYGYESGDDRVNAMIDMINGGGAGRAGEKFEGGGLLSMLGNAFATPYGSGAAAAPTSGSAAAPTQYSRVAPPPMAAPMQVQANQSPYEMFGGQAPAPYAAQSPMEMFGGQAPAPYAAPEPQYSGRGSTGMPYPEWLQDDEMRKLFDYFRMQGVQGY